MKKVLITLLGLGLMSLASAQSNLTLYNMQPLPQRMQMNPALDPDCQWYFGMPAISSVEFGLTTSGITLRRFDEAFEPQGNGEYTFNVASLTSMLDKGTYVNTRMNQEWLNFGFRLGNSMLSFTMGDKVKTRTDIPKDFFTLLLEGNGGENLGKTFDLGFGVDVMHTREFAVGFQHSLFDEDIKVGARLKLVQGLLSFHTERSDLTLTTDPNDFTMTMTSDVSFQMASSYHDFRNDTTFESTSAYLKTKNHGFGLDVGASMNITDKFTVHGSIIDLGFIKWDQNNRNIRSENPGASFEFRGFDIDGIWADTAAFQENADRLIDSINSTFHLDTVDGGSFTTGLIGEFYLGGNLNVTDKHNAGVLFYGSFYNREFYPAMTLSWNSKIGKVLAVSASYTVMRGNFANAGFGMAINGGPEQFYIVSDNVIGAATGNVRNLNVRFGWNHTFGRKKWEENHDITL